MKKRKKSFPKLTGNFWRRIIGRGERPEDGVTGTDGEGDKAERNTSGIAAFSYRYNGSIGGNSFRYELKDGRLSMDFMEHRDYGELSEDIPEGFAEKLEALCDSCRIRRWNGFDKVDRRVLDGSGFSLSIKYADGKTLSAHGSNSFPNGYRDFRTSLEELFAPEREKLFEQARQRLIEKGVGGDPEFIMACFKQNGSSGSDDYHVMFSKSSIRSSNFELRVKSSSGEFFPEGEISYYTTLPDKSLRLEDFGEIVRKYELIKWLDFEKTAHDPDNSEWFQISLSFADGRINAMGTAHPENYDAFRKDFLSLAAKITEEARKNGVLKEKE